MVPNLQEGVTRIDDGRSLVSLLRIVEIRVVCILHPITTSLSMEMPRDSCFVSLLGWSSTLYVDI